MEEQSSNLSDIVTKDGIRRTSKTKRLTRNTGICTRKSCTKNITCRLPPIRQPSRRSEDRWTIKSLPADFNSVSIPTKVIAEVNKKRQIQHEAILDNIKEQFVVIDLDIETQLRLRAELLKKQFQSGQDTTNKYFDTIYVEESEMLLFSKDTFGKIDANITDIYDKYKLKVEIFYHFLQDLEKQRSDKYKKVLKSAYQDLQKICYLLPYDLQQYFEEKILTINQLLLNNFRCYSDLHLTLNLQAESSKHLHMQKLDALTGKWKTIKKREVLMKLNEKRLVQFDCEAMMLETEQGQKATKFFSDKEQFLQGMWTSVSPLPISVKDVHDWSMNMDNIVNSLDFFAKKLIMLYKMAIVQVFNGYFDELQTVTQGMLEMGLADNEEINSMGLELCKPTIETVTHEYSDELVNLEALWDNVITQLQSKLQHTYKFLTCAAHLWDEHFQRLEEAKLIVFKELKNLILKNDKANQDLEIKLNIALDTLRQAPTNTKLEDALDAVNTTLDSLKHTYNSHYTSEVKVVEKYDTLVMEEIEVLLAELHQFLYDHPKVGEAATQIRRPENPYISEKEAEVTQMDARTTVIPKHMKLCEYQVDAVHNWKFGLREAIVRYTDTCRDEITLEAGHWIAQLIKKLGKRLEVKLAVHTPRYNRVKYDIYNIRLAELTYHNDRMTRHKAGAEKEIEAVRSFYANQEKEYQAIIRKYNEKVDAINKRVDNAKMANSIKAYISELTYSTDLCNQKLSNLVQRQENMYHMKSNSIKKAATAFSKQLKLFLEDGNFNYDEAKKVTKDLKTFEKTTKKKFNALTKEIAGKQKKLFAQVQLEEVRARSLLNYSLEEFEFNEKAISMIKDVQLEVKTEAFNMKFLNKKLEQRFQDMEHKSLTNLGTFTTFEQFENDFSGIVVDLLEMINLLYQPEPIINVNIKALTPSDHRKSYASPRVSLNASFLTLLYAFPPRENNSIMSKLCCRLYSSFESLQKEAKEFYSEHNQGIAHEDKVQPTYEKFMKEVLHKYFLYHLQCEILWLNLINEYMESLQKFYRFFQGFRSTFFESYGNHQTGKLKQKHEELLTSVSKIKVSNMQILNKVHGKLKPLHGHKNNRGLLKQLQDEMQETLENIRSFNIDDLMEPYKESQANHVLQYESEVNEARTKLTALYKASFNRLFHVPLIRQFETKLSQMNALISQGLEHGEDNNEINQSYASIKIPPEFDTNLKIIKELLDLYELNSEGITEEDNMRLDNYIQKFKDECDDCMDHVDGIKLSWWADTDSFEEVFDADTQKVLKLYSVKYDNPVAQ